MCAKLSRAQPFSVLLVTFFFLYQKLFYFPLLFWFTQNETEILLAFFAVGYLIGSLNGGLMAMLQVKDKYRQIQVTFLVLFFIAVAIIEACAQTGSIWSISLGAFLLSLSLSILTSIELMLLDIPAEAQVAAPPESSDLFPLVPLTFTFFGLYGVILASIGDKTHFMNRDENTWAYICIAAAAVLVLAACCFTLKWLKNGWTCCLGCCCPCCRPCCQGEEEPEDV